MIRHLRKIKDLFFVMIYVGENLYFVLQCGKFTIILTFEVDKSLVLA